MRTFASVWNEIIHLANDLRIRQEPIFTLKKNTANYIIEITETYIRRDSKGKRTGNDDRVRKVELEQLWDLLVKHGSVKAKDLNAHYFSYSLLNLLNEVNYTVNPLVIFLENEESCKYFLMGSKYGLNYEDMMPYMFQNSVVCVGFYDQTLEKYYRRDEQIIKEFLISEGESKSSYNALKKFLQLKPGDLIAIKKSGSPKGKQPNLIIEAYATVVQRNGEIYYFDPYKLGHCINIEFIDTDLNLEFPIGGYNRTIDRIDDPILIKTIFQGLKQDQQTIRQKIIHRRRKGSRKNNPTGIQQRSGAEPYIANLKHNLIQNHFREYLESKYPGKVKFEEDWIDLSLDMGTYLILYEVKPYYLVEDCIRDAMGQLLLYNFYCEDIRPKKLVIVGPSIPTQDDLRLIETLKESFVFDFNYEAFDGF